VPAFAERQEAMGNLGRSQRRFARAFHANPSAVSMIASDGRVIDVNERWCRLFGHPPERALGATVEELGLDVDPADPASICSRLAGGAVEEHREMRVRDAAGRIRDVVMAMTPARIDGGLCSIVSFIDIGDRLEAEKALRASDQRFRFVLEATHDVVYDRDLATGSTWVSRNGLAQFGYAQGSAMASTCGLWSTRTTGRASPPGSRLPFAPAPSPARRTTGCAGPTAAMPTCTSRPSSSPTATAGHGACIGVVTDITEQHQREELARRLSQASRLTAMGELAASIAHEINQPVSAILTNVDAAEMLLQGPAPPLDELRDVLADIRSDDLRVTDIIRTSARSRPSASCTSRPSTSTP
jgi:PAS domain S-box-containing protein